MNKREEKVNKILAEKMKESVLEVPSMDFTKCVLNQIQTASVASKALTTYQPLISKKVWMAIAVVFVGIVMYTYFSGIEVSGWNDALVDLKMTVSNWNINRSSWSPKIPSPLIYGVVILSGLLLIEIPILKRQLKL